MYTQKQSVSKDSEILSNIEKKEGKINAFSENLRNEKFYVIKFPYISHRFL